MKVKHRIFAGILAFAVTVLTSALPAATLTLFSYMPAAGTNDIYNLSGASRDGSNVTDGGVYADGSANDAFTYVAGDRASQGQTFTTGNNTNGCVVTAIWVRHAGYTNNSSLTYWQMNSGATLTIRITDPSQAGTAGFPIRTETYVATGTEGWAGAHNAANGDGYWLRFALASPVTLQTNKTYGFDITSGSTAAFFEWLGTSNNVFAGGNAYKGTSTGAADNTLNALVGDRVFLLEMTGSPATNAPPAPSNDLVAVPFNLTNVTLLPSAFQTNMLLDKQYLLSLDGNRLLYSFRSNVGLSASNALAYGGWEAPSDTLCLGHFVGHYLSACSMMYASTGDAQLKARTDYLVAELAKCQAASPGAGFNTGYLSAFPESYINDVINQTQSGYFSVPWYTLHKVMAGLLDAYQYTANNQALTVLTNMANWVQFRMDQLSSNQIQGMLNFREYGGMNEVLANLYPVTGNTNYLRIAADFDKQSLFSPLSLDQDVLDGLHANTQIPEIIGAAREFELTGTASYHEVANFFWNRVVNQRSYALGGNSDAEHFFPVTDFPSHLTGQTAETCNTYNMLKLSRHLFEWAPSAAVMDYYERALYNQILGSETAPGSMTYFVSLLPGHFKTYSTTENSFWCCDGTGVENHSKYGDTIYFHDTNSLYLNLFIPSQLSWPEKGLTVVQNAAFPENDTTTLTFRCTNGFPLTLNIRYPSWAKAGMALSINGVAQSITNFPGSYVRIQRSWNSNDQVQVQFPMTLRAEVLQDTANTVAVFYGPILLAGALGTNGMPASDLAVNQWDLLGVPIPAGTVPAIVADIPSLLSNTIPLPGQPLTFRTQGLGRTNDATLVPFYKIQHQRYSVYWNLITPSAVSDWSGAGASANWTVGGNWNLAPTNQCQVRFGGLGGSITNDLASGTQLDGIRFLNGAGAFVLNGNGIVLQGDVVNDSAATQQINFPLQLGSGLTWYFNTAAGDLWLGGSVSGSGGLDKRGSHTLTVTSDLAFNGSVQVSAGLMQIGNGDTSGSLGNLSVFVGAGASLAFNRNDTFNVDNSIAGPGTVIQRGSGVLQLSGTWSNSGPTIVETGALQVMSRAVPVLQHRWSFNGEYTDSVGTNTAAVIDVGTRNTTLTSSNITLTGGTQSAADYVSLGNGLLPKDGSPATIELWATQVSVQNWSRIFDVGSSTSDYFFMSWSQGTSSNLDRVEWKDAATSTADNTCAPYTNNTEFHIVVVIIPGGGTGGSTRVTWYAAPAGSASLGAARGTFDTANTLATLNDANFWLGRSEYADATANARYNEVRIWNRAFTANELQQLHSLGPDSIGMWATNTVTGQLSGQSALSVFAGAQVNVGNSMQTVGSLSGATGSTIQLNGGQLEIGTGGNEAATFAGAMTGSGSIVVNGTLRLVGNASIAAGITLTNNGILDIMTWNGTLPPGFVNHGVVLDRSLVRVESVSGTANLFQLIIHGYSGHNYQLEFRDNLAAGDWQDLGQAQVGNDSPLFFTNAIVSGDFHRFYRVKVTP